MIGLVLADYVLGLLIDSAKKESYKKLWLILAIASNLGVLFIYKYLGFAIATINAALRVSVPVPEIVMPIGISFFTFQTMSYPSMFIAERSRLRKIF